MSKDPDTARRERAKKLRERAVDWLGARVARGPQACEVYDFETFAIGYSDHRDLARLVGFCAGAREEAAIQVAEIAALTEQTYRLGEKWMEEQSARASERDESRAEIAALRDVVSLQGSALREIRIRLHAAGRRPEECYEMSILDDTIAAVRRALEAAK